MAGNVQNRSYAELIMDGKNQKENSTEEPLAHGFKDQVGPHGKLDS